MYIIEPGLIKEIPDNIEFPITELLNDTEKNSIGYYLIDGEWFDVGQHKDLDKARGFS